MARDVLYTDAERSGWVIFPSRCTCTFDVRDDDKRVIATVTRIARARAGWMEVTYRNRRYVLNGGIRTPFWINVDRPIPLKGAR